MPDLPLRLKQEELEVGMVVDIMYAIKLRKTGVDPLARGRIIQLHGNTRSGIRLSTARVLVEVTRVFEPECGLIFCEVNGRHCKCKALQHKQHVAQTCNIHTFGDALKLAGDAPFTFVEDYKRLRSSFFTEPNVDDDDAVVQDDTTLGDEAVHELHEDEANDGSYEQISGKTVAQRDKVDFDLEISPELLLALDRLADLIQEGVGDNKADEEEEDADEQNEPTTVPDVMPDDARVKTMTRMTMMTMMTMKSVK